MSLETHMAKNNELLEMLIPLLRRLVAANDEQMVTSANPEPFVQLVVDNIVPINQPDKKKKSSVKKEVDNTPVDIETLDLETVVAVAVLFKNDAYELTADKLAKARAVIEGVGEEERNGQADALDAALQGLQELNTLTKATILDLCLEMLGSWDDIPGITERREFALALLKEGTTTTSHDEAEDSDIQEEATDIQALISQAGQLILQLAKGGYKDEALGILAKYGAKKLGQVPDEKIPEVIRLAEAALEG